MPSKKHKSWQQVRKLLYGQLLLFSSDGFTKDIYMGVIRESDREEMNKTHSKLGYVIIRVEMINLEGKKKPKEEAGIERVLQDPDANL